MQLLTYLTLLSFFLLAPAAVWGQDIVWIRQFGGISPANDFAASTAVDANGNVSIYVAGSTDGIFPGQTSAGSLDAFIRKYDSNGNEVWSRQFGSSGFDQANGVIADASGVYVAGSTTGTFLGQISSGGWDAFIRKYDANGSELWTRQFGSSSDDDAFEVAVDASGVYVTGDAFGALPGQTSAGGLDAFIRKYDFNGNEVWSRQFRSSSFDQAIGVAADFSGIYVVGRTEGILPGQIISSSASGLDAFIRKYDANGNELWSRQFGSQTSDQALKVAIDFSDVYVVGDTYGAFPGQISSGDWDAFVRKYDANGNELWTRQFGSPAMDVARGVAADASGLYVVGRILFGALPGQTSLGSWDAFVRKYETNGSEIWTRQFGSPADDRASGVAADASGAYVAGSTTGALPGQTSSGDLDAFLAKFVGNSSPAIVNHPPVANAGGPYSVNEGGSVLVTASGSDSDSDTLIFNWDLDNNGSFETPGQSATFSAAGLDGPSSRTITVEVTDSGGLSATDQATVNLQNVAPTVGAITASETQWVNVAMVSANFTDPGTLDIHTAVWDWGDLKTSSGKVSEANGSGSVSGSHIYAAFGVYTITLTVTDKDGGSGQSTLQFYVIYDPVGGGWIDSPAGAYTLKPSLTGRAQFGFVSRHQKGAKGTITPDGQTEFNFPAANLNFRSTSYEQLTISMPKSQFKGSGSINNTGNYGFLMSIIDGQLTVGGGVDKFRIKIWDKATGNVVYDNQMGAPDDADPTQEIAAGSISIQDGFKGLPAAPSSLPLSQLPRPLAMAIELPKPKVTSLGAAFPNPFNPETWIPYALAKEVKVIIRIYNVSGKIIRSLDLGHKAAGFYTTKDKAAYWDGRNEHGEGVSSGIYFYAIQAGAYMAARKMLLLK